MCTLLDAHVHLHGGFSVTPFLKAAASNFDRAAESLSAGTRVSARVLAVCGIEDECPLARFRDDSDWSAAAPDEHTLIVSSRGGGEDIDRLVLVAGRQVVTREKLEVLSLFSSAAIEHGNSLSETVDEVTAAGGVPVLPWGFGKWFFRRQELLTSFLQTLGADTPQVLLGDNGCRWQLWRSSILSNAEQNGINVIAGSDPLPVASHVDRAGAFGSVLEKQLDFDRPAQWLRDEVRQLHQSPQTFGNCRSLISLLSDQVRIRMRRA